MPTLFKETIAKNTVEMSVCDCEIFVFHYKGENDYKVWKYEQTSDGMHLALNAYESVITELLALESAKADEEEGLYDDGYEFPAEEE
jgi:hypothetical protein